METAYPAEKEQPEVLPAGLVSRVTALRRQLHQIPELAFRETETKKTLLEFLRQDTSLEVHDCGAWFYAEWNGKDEAAIAFRADFDAVEGGDGKAGHYCGHDGHSAILAGFAVLLSSLKPQRHVLLVFQPAEEIGQGARLCMETLAQKNISAIYGFHNIPGYEAGTVLLLDHTFACGSTGVEITLTGSASHAAYPEAGRNPAAAISALVLYMQERLLAPHDGVLLGTVIGIDLGSSAYGVSAGRGTLRLTLRAETEAMFRRLVSDMTGRAQALAAAQGLRCEIRYVDYFPATENTPACVEQVRRAAEASGIHTVIPQEPMRWSEDFGYYTQKLPGGFFGVGSGKDHPQLHTPEYEFPDAIIPTVLQLYRNLL